MGKRGKEEEREGMNKKGRGRGRYSGVGNYTSVGGQRTEGEEATGWRWLAKEHPVICLERHTNFDLPCSQRVPAHVKDGTRTRLYC